MVQCGARSLVRVAEPQIEAIEPSAQGLLLRWSGGQGPFAVERTDQIPAASWNADLTTIQKSATLPTPAGTVFYRILDLGPAVSEIDAFLEARNGDPLLRDLAGLVRIPTYRDDSSDSEARVIRNLESTRAYLQARVDSFNAGQRTLMITPFEWRAEVGGVSRWVFGFRVGNGPRKFSVFAHLDTVPPGDDSWNPFQPRIERRLYRGAMQDFLIGRGSIDDKGPAVIALSVLEAAAKRFDGGVTVGDATLEVAFDTAEETDFSLPAYLNATGSPELGIVFDAFWTVRAEKGVERPVFHLPIEEVEGPGLRLLSFTTSPGPANQIPDHAIATIGGSQTALDALGVVVSNRYANFGFDDPNYRRAPLTVTRGESTLVLTSTVEGAQHGSAPAENRAHGANPVVSLANFLAGLADEGTLATNGYARLAQFIAWGWGTSVFGEKHPELLMRSDDVFTEGNGTTYALTQVTTNSSSVSLAIDIRYAQGHQSLPWDGVTDGLLSGTSRFPEVLATLVDEFNALHPDARLTFETRNHGVPDIRNPESEKFRRIRAAYEEVTGKECSLFAIGGGSDAHGYPNLIAAGALFSADFDPPINYHGVQEGAPLQDLRLSARILWRLLLHLIEDPPNPSAALRTFLDDDWKYWMAQYPEAATVLGYPGQNARWTDYSEGAIAARNDQLRRSLDRLKTIDRAGLEAPDQLDYDLYLEMLQSAVTGLDFGNDALPLRQVVPHNLYMPVNQLEGMLQDVPRTLAMMPAATVADYEDILRRLIAIPDLSAATMALMRKGIEKQLTPPAITLRDVPDQAGAQVFADPMASPLLSAFRNFPPGIDEVVRTRLTEAAVTAYREHVGPSFKAFQDFLVKEYLPACRDSVGVDAMTNGDTMYAFNVRWHTTTAKTPKEIHEIGLSEVKRIRAEMDAVMASAGFTGTFDDFKTFLRTNPQFFFQDAASLVAAYRDIAKRADPQLAHLFGTLPRLPYGVIPVPDAIAPSQTTAYYDAGALSEGRPAFMYVNTYRLDMRPKWEMEALTLHEAVPGHHIQISIAQEIPDLPEFRKNTSYTAFVEGWALYAESLGPEMGFYQDPYSKFGQLTYEMWRAVRLVVDTGLHAMGWTRQEAIDYFAANTPKTLQDITVEVDRYIVWPGQALGYKMGQLKIRDLRTKAEQKLGAKFDVRAFHDVVLGQGAVPMDVLERQVDTWIAAGGQFQAGRP
ncbi:MAG: DUF885 family protein [Verrucomicrobiales bacterium]|nr:DUF885 family protein [Verrucomicrobiales bacterium]